MKLSRQAGRAERVGFTLIELLVVIAIIGILVSLTAAAVMHSLTKGPQVTTRTEIGQLENAIQGFQSFYKVDHIPSRIMLRKYLQDYYIGGVVGPNNYLSDLDRDSVTYLTNVFHNGGTKFKTQWLNITATGGINWHASWSTTPRVDTHQILEGDQCLVFFLGGMQTLPSQGPPGCIGFSADDANPAEPTNSNRHSFYEFKSARLFIRPNATLFFSYEDAYGKKQPYAYFSAYGKDNGYNPYDINNNYYARTPPPPRPPTSDCLTLRVWPYAEASQPTYRYLKKNTYQIISAGADGKFGPGTDRGIASPYVWNTATANAIDPFGKDDQANIASTLLGVGE